MKRLFLCLVYLLVCSPVFAQIPDTVFLEELTWMEVRNAIRVGKTTVILPTGGTEQNGPHMVLGKHNFIVKRTSELIARRLGNALVAPVVTYVPEGDVDPPTGWMEFPGTITLPDEYFMKLLEYAARSFKAHGFKNIVFIGDSGGNQAGQRTVADALNKEWAGSGVRVHHVADYYGPGNGFTEWLTAQGEKPGIHASIVDTSLLMAVNPGMIRPNQLANFNRPNSGVNGDPRNASVEYGRKGIEMMVEVTLKRLKEMLAAK
jgi:creatinine amidohydrolase